MKPSISRQNTDIHSNFVTSSYISISLISWLEIGEEEGRHRPRFPGRKPVNATASLVATGDNVCSLLSLSLSLVSLINCSRRKQRIFVTRKVMLQRVNRFSRLVSVPQYNTDKNRRPRAD